MALDSFCVNGGHAKRPDGKRSQAFHYSSAESVPLLRRRGITEGVERTWVYSIEDAPAFLSARSPAPLDADAAARDVRYKFISASFGRASLNDLLRARLLFVEVDNFCSL